jgi:hypothetical protein
VVRRGGCSTPPGDELREALLSTLDETWEQEVAIDRLRATIERLTGERDDRKKPAAERYETFLRELVDRSKNYCYYRKLERAHLRLEAQVDYFPPKRGGGP